MQGLGVHWELWSIASGGMKNHDVLRVGTVFGAEAIGFGKELGTLEGGKLADLQVLDANPLENIRNTNTIRYVMKNGRLYDAESLTEIWPRQRPIDRPWWWEAERPLAAGGILRSSVASRGHGLLNCRTPGKLRPPESHSRRILVRQYAARDTEFL